MQPLLKRLAFLAALSFAILGFAQAQDDATLFTAELSGGNVVPAVDTGATGYAIALLVGDTLYVAGSYSGLSTPIASQIRGGVHIHMAPAGENGPIAFDLSNTAGMAGTFNGTFTLDAEQMEALTSGNFYVQLHTEQNNPGELRGALTEPMN